jgi:hypothetical protein
MGAAASSRAALGSTGRLPMLILTDGQGLVCQETIHAVYEIATGKIREIIKFNGGNYSKRLKNKS